MQVIDKTYSVTSKQSRKNSSQQMTGINEAQPSLRSHYGRLISLTVPYTGNLTPSQFLLSQRGEPRFYWSAADDSTEIVGVGKALELTSYGRHRFTDIQSQLKDLYRDALIIDDCGAGVAPRVFGGFAFSDDFIPDVAWTDFIPAHFMLPHYQLTRTDKGDWLTLNVHISPDDDIAQLQDELWQTIQERIADAENPVLDSLPHNQLVQVSHPFPYNAWDEMIQQALQQLASGRLKKVVLSRFVEAWFEIGRASCRERVFPVV